MTKMIMNVSGTVCQLIHFFPGKQMLAIILKWPAFKSEQRTCIELLDCRRRRGGGGWVGLGEGINLFYCCI